MTSSNDVTIDILVVLLRHNWFVRPRFG